MKIYTKTGDNGTTALIGGTRVAKHHIRIEAYGTVDELNSFIGLLNDNIDDKNINKDLIKIQNELFNLGAYLSLDPEKEKLANGKPRLNIPNIDKKMIDFLENKIDEMNENLPPMTNFILPGGHQTVSICHICRTITRRAERRATAINEVEAINPFLIKYLNRLSDYLFVLARKLSVDLKIIEVPWNPK